MTEFGYGVITSASFVIVSGYGFSNKTKLFLESFW